MDIVVKYRNIFATFFVCLSLSCDSSRPYPRAVSTELKETVADQYSSGREVFPFDAKDFRFSYGVGDALFGMESFDATSSGELRYITWNQSSDEGKWTVYEARVSRKEMREFGNELQRLGIFTLNAVYSSNLADGKVRSLIIHSNGPEKTIWCAAYIPKEIWELEKTIDKFKALLVRNGKASKVIRSEAMEMQNRKLYGP